MFRCLKYNHTRKFPDSFPACNSDLSSGKQDSFGECSYINRSGNIKIYSQRWKYSVFHNSRYKLKSTFLIFHNFLNFFCRLLEIQALKLNDTESSEQVVEFIEFYFDNERS